VLDVQQETKKVVPRQDLECSLTWQSLHAVVNRRIKTGVETFPPDDPARIQYDEYYQEVVYRRAVAEGKCILIPRCAESPAASQWV
jgi:hypothetical protein